MRLRSASAEIGKGSPVLLHDIAFKTAKWLAHTFLRWSDFWGDVAESLHTGEPFSEIRRRREEGE